MRRILVTGARGFIGRQVTAALEAAGAEVHAVTSGAPPEGTAVRWHRADILDAADRLALLDAARADTLLHLAWCARPPAYWRDPDNVRWVGATLDLARAFRERGGSRLVGVGSCAEYDWGHGYCVERRTPLVAATLYGTAKAACGQVLEAYGAESGLSTAWARLFFLFGPYDSPLRLVPSLVQKITAGEPARCTAGAHVRDFLYSADAAAAIAALLASPVTGPVNIASGAPIRVGDLAARVAAIAGRPDLLTIEEGPAENALVAADVTRLREEVGWRPRHDAIEALEATVRWWSAPERREVTA